MKKCSKCQEILDDSLFYKNDKMQDGLSSYCKKCAIENSLNRYKNKNTEVKSYQSQYSKTHRTMKNNAWHKWWEKNKEKKREQNRNWHRLKNDM